MLVRRAIEPGYGLWVFPGGYVDRGEELGGRGRYARRARSRGSTSRSTASSTSIPTATRPSIIVVYAATAIGGDLCGDEECLEAKLFRAEEIPWDELAFRSTREALREYLDGVRVV